MFTGLIKKIGTIVHIQKKGIEATLKISSTLDTPKIGDSIAVNGACLSVTNSGTNFFEAFVSAETLSITKFETFRPGTLVNLEPALLLGDKLDGHLVTGHIDTTIEILSIQKLKEASKFRFCLPEHHQLACEIAPKGSVAINGCSLTINEVTTSFFETMIIPITFNNTTFKELKKGSFVNLETDLLAKYVSKKLDSLYNFKEKNNSAGLDKNILTKNGFMRF
jgi:riboflavin synthase